MRTLLLSLAFVLVATIARAEPFEIKDGDRVLFLGDTLLEREGTYGYLETRMVEQFPDRRFTVRNLAFSADTPLGWSRASFDPPAKGFERLKEQLALVQPTVAFLGYGMAASLQEMTDRSQDWTLNRDPARYGAEPMSAARFKKELAQCMDAIVEVNRKADTGNRKEGAAAADENLSGIRFVLLSPIRHEDLRSGGSGFPARPGLPDPTEHNKLLEQYSKAIEELAKERGARFVALATPASQYEITMLHGEKGPLTENGIHASPVGWQRLTAHIAEALGWSFFPPTPAGPFAFDNEPEVLGLIETKRMFEARILPAIIRKNALFFHRWRPANETYLFGFRKREQGKNAVEIPKFDPLIEAAEAEIERLKKAASATAPLPNDERRASGRVGVTPAGSGVSPEPSSVERTPNRDTPSGNARNSTPDGPRETRGPAGGTPTLPEARPSASANTATSEPARQTPAETPDHSKLPASFTSQPHPTFTLADGLEISLWAENPLLAKPTQMNWDAKGRLWVASSAMYPQIAPGQTAFDKILVLEDTNGDGKAEKSSIFADGLLIPTGVAPVLTPEGHWACYVGQSTELLYFEDTDGDGKADRKRIVFSGFGTEDTHHIVHTLRWGPDGRLYFSQSVYIHTHMETPWGVVRVNSGGVFAYDPRTERVEVVEKGLWNTWGHAWDKWGQAFYTDGAGSTGLSWGFPGATFAPNEGARRTTASISPGSYPKFAGLELIYSPHFPADWQGSAVTCDFRAHKIVHFKISDLGFQISDLGKPAEKADASSRADTATNQKSEIRNQKFEPKSGYVTEQLPVLVQTSDATFRPIDVKLGPDGALYIADWSNPIINHGEVDFRDPRRDHEHGRIWRLSMKGGAAVKWESLAGGNWPINLDSNSLWTSEQAMQVARKEAAKDAKVLEDERKFHASIKPKPGIIEDFVGPSPVRRMLRQFRGVPEEPIRVSAFRAGQITASLGEDPGYFSLHLLDSPNPSARAAAVQLMSSCAAHPESLTPLEPYFGKPEERLGLVHAGIRDSHPRVRLEAMRVLARIPTLEHASLILDAAIHAPKDDPQYEFAAWLSINDLAPQVAEWVEKHSADTAANADAPDAGQDASGSARAPRAVPGAPPGTSGVERRPNQDAPLANDHKQTPGASGGAPDAAREARALPITPDDRADRDAKIVLALQSLPPDTSSPLLSKILAKRGLPLDGSGPWIELIGNTGGPGELRPLLDALLAATTPDGDNTKPLADAKHNFKTPGANARAAAALLAAARRGAKPVGEMPPATFFTHAPTDALPDVLRLAGLWKQNVPAAIFATLDTRASAPVLDAAFDALRTLATPETADFLTAYFDPAVEQKLNNEALRKVIAKSDKNWRTHALIALAALRPNEAMKYLGPVLKEVGEPGHLQLWRDLFASQPFLQRFSQAVPKNLPPAAYAAAMRAAREMGRKGDGLANKLAPLAGESTQQVAPADYNDLAARAKKDGDPVAGEAMYRRMASACTTCHAIGGAGGKLGPDMTSIGASAPPDYIIESILNPTAKVKEGYHAFSFTMKDGTEAIGIPSRETPQEQFIRTLAGEQGLPKANIVSKKIAEGGASLMPAGLVNSWTDRERLNLYAFLMELGRPGPFDASKNNVARVWQLTDSGATDGVLKNDTAASVPSTYAYTLVDGRLTKDLLAEKLTLLAPKNAAVHLTARFQAASAGKAKLNLTGIRKAWLDGQPLAVASEPSPSVELSPGAHTFTVEVDAKSPPEVVRVESPAVSFLGD